VLFKFPGPALLVLAQSGRTVVRQNRARRDARGVFTSIADLKRKLMRYIRRYNEPPKPVKWKYFDPTRRITSDSTVTGHYFLKS
jgi:hypothetical protein